MQTEPQRDGQPVDPLVANLQRLEADSRDGAVQKDVLIAWDIENAQLPSNVPVAEVERCVGSASSSSPTRFPPRNPRAAHTPVGRYPTPSRSCRAASATPS